MPFLASAAAAGAFECACGSRPPAMADATVVPTVASRKRRRVNPSFVFWFSPSGEEFFMTFSVEAGLMPRARLARAANININGARGGNRTHTALRPPDFESGASASSATRASDADERLARRAVSLNQRIYRRDAS